MIPNPSIGWRISEGRIPWGIPELESERDQYSEGLGEMFPLREKLDRPHSKMSEWGEKEKAERPNKKRRERPNPLEVELDLSGERPRGKYVESSSRRRKRSARSFGE